jgi:hypothetical protein
MGGREDGERSALYCIELLTSRYGSLRAGYCSPGFVGVNTATCTNEYLHKASHDNNRKAVYLVSDSHRVPTLDIDTTGFAIFQYNHERRI